MAYTIDVAAIKTANLEARYALRAALDDLIAARTVAGLPTGELEKLAAFIPAEPEE